MKSSHASIDHDPCTGFMVQRQTNEPDGRVVKDEWDRNTGHLTELSIKNPDGTNITLKQGFDPFTSMWSGQRVDAADKPIENVYKNNDFLIYMSADSTNQTVTHIEKLLDPPTRKMLPTITEGTANIDRGTFTHIDSTGVQHIDSIAPGRSDLIYPNGNLVWNDGHGAEWIQWPNGQASVKHADGSQISLFADNRVLIHSPDNQKAIFEPLSTSEVSFLESHPGVDRRDVAEIHRLFEKQPDKLAAFYENLSKFDSSTQLSSEQKSDMQAGILRNVANPASIFQGKSGACNVTQIERELAIENPTKLTQTIFDATEHGQIQGASGQVFLLEQNKLVGEDASGRNLASRVFQNTALEVELSKQNQKFDITPDGAGRVSSQKSAGGDAKTSVEKFTGLSPSKIADIGFELSGETHSRLQVKDIGDLAAAFSANGNRSFIATVDSGQPPISKNIEGTGRGNHVITVTDVKQMPDGNYKVYFQNQWGIASDHSTDATAVDGTAFVKNMLTANDKQGMRSPIPLQHGLVIIRGLQQDSVYKVQDGKLVLTPSPKPMLQLEPAGK